MALKNNPLQQRKKGFFVDVKTITEEIKESKEESEALTLPEDTTEKEKKDSQNANHELQNTKHETENAKHETQKEKVVFLSTRVYKSQDKWLDETIEHLQEIHKRKLIKKEVLVQQALKLLQSKNIDWYKVKSEEDLEDQINS